MDKQDLREYGEQELSLHVFNDEYLYKRRHNYHFLDLVKEMFLFTEEQEETLIQDLEDDLNEEE